MVDSSRDMVLGVWGSLGGRDDKVMVQVVIYMSCTTRVSELVEVPWNAYFLEKCASEDRKSKFRDKKVHN